MAPHQNRRRVEISPSRDFPRRVCPQTKPSAPANMRAVSVRCLCRLWAPTNLLASRQRSLERAIGALAVAHRRFVLRWGRAITVRGAGVSISELCTRNDERSRTCAKERKGGASKNGTTGDGCSVRKSKARGGGGGSRRAAHPPCRTGVGPGVTQAAESRPLGR